MSDYQTLIIGSSPNALVAAARLARSGVRTLVLETKESVGGAVSTEAFAPGFRADVAVNSAAIDGDIARALGLSVEVIRRSSATLLSSQPMVFSALPELPRALLDAAELLGALYRSTPPEVPALGPGGGSLDELKSRLEGLGPRGMHEVLRLTFMSARDFFSESLGSEAARALCAGIALRGVFGGPFAPGSLFPFMHQLALGDALVRSTAKGGIQKLAESIAEIAARASAEIRTGVAGPIQIDVEDGAVRGVRLGDGTRITAEVIVSDYDARKTFTELVSPAELDPETNRAIRTLRYRGSVARVHLALKELPQIAGLDRDALKGTLIIAPSVSSLERAWDEAKRGMPSSQPYVEVAIPTLNDPSLAPDGKHVLDVWVQHVPYRRGDRAAVLRRVYESLGALSPKLPELVLHDQVLLPEDLEQRFGVTEGQLFGGEIRLDQAFFLRPIAGSSGYRSPVDNLFLVGSAAHPGGYSGRSGWNLAGHLASNTFGRA